MTSQDEIKNFPLAQILVEYIDVRETDASTYRILKPKTIALMKTALEFVKADIANITVEGWTLEHSENLFAKAKKELSAPLAACVENLVSGAFYWLELPEMLERPPEVRVKNPTLSELQYKQVWKMLEKSKYNRRDSLSATLALEFLMATGLRKSEVMKLEWSSIDLEAGVLELTNARTKVFTRELTSLQRKILREAKDLRKNEEDLHVFPMSGGRGHGLSLGNILATRMEEARLEGTLASIRIAFYSFVRDQEELELSEINSLSAEHVSKLLFVDKA
ncbi:tyrosine-type recombinase/integrase [Pseudovibrio sp. Tun.PSC04-5.I4]|uniref:tyrosine-type recombinase/integrase n=1 Tax=Pseudovibrio sp. Tun.PSC04-5.I4 TaxID=1798213 RepID=UPI00087E2835|nr:tyrosine-type recombinase/integrase [Pseudovibrio sp. Tun.PSC04-5.I4]SDQ24668.1 Phage integrase family protein [Pseudovibrio sp. Tun.PSC04-5.I4]